MTDTFSQVPPNSTGKKIRLFENTVGADNVSSEATTITDQTGQVMKNMGVNGRVYVDASEVAVPVTDNGGSLTVDGTVSVTNAAGASAVNIQDGGNSITVDGSVTAIAQPGVDIGDVTVNNAAGASAVNIQDGGNSITVDGTVTANAGTGPWPVTDNAGSLTVDAPVGTPVFTRLSDGTSALTTTGGALSVSDRSTLVDNAGFTDGTTPVGMAGYIFDESAGTALTENDAAAARVDSKRAQIGVIEDATTRGQRAAVSSVGAVASNITQLGGATPSVSNALPARLTDGTNFIGSNLGVDGDYHIASAIIQDVHVSTTNSSTTNIASAASFTGTSIGTLGVNSIQVNLFADQNCTVQVQQSQEGTNWNIIDTYTYTANSTDISAGRTFQAVASFVRVIVTNNGGSTTTSFRLQTILCPSANPLPRALTQSGNLKVTSFPDTTGGLTIFRSIGAGTGQSVKASAGQLYGWYMYNDTNGTRYVKIYNTAGTPTAGSGTPVMTIPIPAGSAANVEFSNGIAFATGIGMTIVTTAPDAGSTTTATSEVIVNLLYK